MPTTHENLYLQGNNWVGLKDPDNPCICRIAALTTQGIVQSQHLPIFSLKQAPEDVGNSKNERMSKMAVASTQTALKGAPVFGIASLVETVKTRVARYRMYRQTVNELSVLSDRELADLGLHRSMIRRLAQQATEEQTAQ